VTRKALRVNCRAAGLSGLLLSVTTARKKKLIKFHQLKKKKNARKAAAQSDELLHETRKEQVQQDKLKVYQSCAHCCSLPV